MMKTRIYLSGLPERAKVHLGLALAMSVMHAGNSMLLDLLEAHPELNDTIPKEWPFKLSLDEQGAELNACQLYYRDLAVVDIANALLSEMYKPEGKEDA
jgi:hypothetical protein